MIDRVVGQNLLLKNKNEAKKMGFTRCFVPESNLQRMTAAKGIELKGIKTVSEAMEELF